MEPNNHKKMTVSVDEAAKILGIGRAQAYTGVKSGEIPAIRIGRRMLISVRVIERMLETGTNSEDET